MTGILALCITMVGLILVLDASTSIVLPRSPHSIFGLAVCLSSSPSLLEKFQGMGSSSHQTLRGYIDGWLYKVSPANAERNVEIHTKERLASNDELEMREPENSVFRPASLSFTARMVVALVLIAITISLEVTLRISKKNDGLGNVPAENRYTSYLWTVLPTVIFTLISMYCSSADFDTRCLSPFLHLAQGSSFESSAALDLINKHPLLLFYEELKSRSFEAMASTLAVTITSFLTIFSAGLFTGVSFATTIPSQVHVADFIWYRTSGVFSNDGTDYSLNTAALVLDANLTYPHFTYEDLVLPNITIDREFLTRHPNSSNVEFSVTLPAARPSFASCRLYNSSQIRLDFAFWSEDGISVVIKPEQCFVNSTAESWNIKVQVVAYETGGWYNPTSKLPWLPPHAYFGAGVGNDKYFGQGCSQRLWAWGRWTSETGNGSFPQVLSVSALGCNESMEVVDVSATLFGSNLVINPRTPPITNESSATTVVMRKWRGGYGDLYASISGLSTNMTDRIFDTFFTLLTTSRYAVTLEMLGDSSQAAAVADAIQFQHRVLVTQLTAASRRLVWYANDTVMRELDYEIVPGTNTTSSYNVTASIPSSRHRVVQDELSTRFLQGLLVAALICCLANWYFMHSAGGCQMIPRKPTTIANAAALLADGNLIELLSTIDADLSAPKHTKENSGQLEDCVFRLGWRESGHSEQVYCIYVSTAK